MDTMRMKAVLLFAATLAFASAPLWTSGFGGFDPNRYPIPQIDPPVQPAGYAFSIWGPIYLWLIAHGAFGLFARSDDPAWDRTRWPLMVALVAGTPWISVAMVSPVMATVLIWVMLAGAVAAFLAAPRDRDPWLLAAPLGLFAGWLTAASFVSLGLLGAGWGVLTGETGWAWIALAGALLAAWAVISRAPARLPYAAAVAWALVAVAVANWGANLPIAAGALAGAGAVALMAARPRAS